MRLRRRSRNVVKENYKSDKFASSSPKSATGLPWRQGAAYNGLFSFEVFLLVSHQAADQETCNSSQDAEFEYRRPASAVRCSIIPIIGHPTER